MIISEKQKANSRSPLFRNVLWVATLLTLMAALPAAAAANQDGILQREIRAHEDLVTIKLLGVTDYDITEIFDALLINAPGVMEAKRYRFRLDPQRPAVCMVEWQVRITGTDLFQLENDLYNMLQNTASGHAETGQSALALRTMAKDSERLKAIKPWRASSREIQFLSGPMPREGREQRRISPDRGFE